MSSPITRILIVGGGAREHALALALAQPGRFLFAAPGNPGIAEVAAVSAVAADDLDGLVALALETKAELVVIGPEVPLVLGLVDRLREVGIRAFGPEKRGAELEGSKAFMKRFCARHAIPTAAFEVFAEYTDACAYVKRRGAPIVVKASGLAAGKGVVVASTEEEALRALKEMMVDRIFGEAGSTVVVEDLLPGEEASFHVIVDGTAYIALPSAKDHKRIYDGDRGPNTGGMGCVSPAPAMPPDVVAKVCARIIEPTLRGLVADGIDYRGVLFAGLMIENGEPRLLEYNVRFGDPEATAILPLLEGDVAALLADPARAIGAGGVRTRSGASVSVVLASRGYPSAPTLGDEICGMDSVPASVRVLHAGTKRTGAQLRTAGGRVMVVQACADTIGTAQEHAYAGVRAITFSGKQFRSDIGSSTKGVK